jgi:hypothetical protein
MGPSMRRHGCVASQPKLSYLQASGLSGLTIPHMGQLAARLFRGKMQDIFVAQIPLRKSGRQSLLWDYFLLARHLAKTLREPPLPRVSPNTPCASPDTLIELKRGGISPTILRAMPEAGSPRQISNQNPKASSVPTSYGYYVFVDDKYMDLIPTKVAVVIGLAILGNGYAVDGFSGNAPQVFATEMPVFFVYQQNMNVAELHLAKLDFVSNMKASQFNMTGTDPQFFQGIYRTDYNHIVEVNLWRPQEQEISLSTEPVTERSGMFRLTTVKHLTPGKYALFFGRSVHASNMIFATRMGGAEQTAFYFEIRSN